MPSLTKVHPTSVLVWLAEDCAPPIQRPLLSITSTNAALHPRQSPQLCQSSAFRDLNQRTSCYTLRHFWSPIFLIVIYSSCVREVIYTSSLFPSIQLQYRYCFFHHQVSLLKLHSKWCAASEETRRLSCLGSCESDGNAWMSQRRCVFVWTWKHDVQLSALCNGSKDKYSGSMDCSLGLNTEVTVRSSTDEGWRNSSYAWCHCWPDYWWKRTSERSHPWWDSVAPIQMLSLTSSGLIEANLMRRIIIRTWEAKEF